jgi:Family of unknown function (DUF5996)
VISVTSSRPEAWPSLPLGAWASTHSTLHRWLQIVGKIRLVQTPWLNHSWPATLYVTARGLTTSSIPYEDRTFQIDFNFIDHRLEVTASDGTSAVFHYVSSRWPRSTTS